MYSTIAKVITISLIRSAICTISGISYLDPLNPRPLPGRDGRDACNPLYWYPRHIPDYCYKDKKVQDPHPVPGPIPIPIPMPMPLPPPLPVIPPPMPMIPPPIPVLPPPMPVIPPPMPMIPPPMPMVPPPMPMLVRMPYPPMHQSYPLPYNQPQIGMVPGIRGLVSPDGGINILPFSDAYTNLLERNKYKMIKRRMKKILRDYDDYPWIRKRKRHRKLH